jgi:hypothetical protein
MFTPGVMILRLEISRPPHPLPRSIAARSACLAGLAFALIAAAGCGRHAQSHASADPLPQPQSNRAQIKPAPPTPIAVKRVELGQGDPWNPTWDVMIEKALPRDLFSNARSSAVAPLCPRFRYMTLANKRAFWAYFFQALAGAEAGLEPTADVRHTDPAVAVIDTVTHRTVRQEGLLQLTYMDSKRYGCNFDWTKDKNLPEEDPAKTILDPRNNLLCGIRILHDQLIAQKKPLLTESSYWVTLRPSHPSFEVFWKQMANVPDACGQKTRQPIPEQRGPEEPTKTTPSTETAEQSATR